MRKVYQLFIDKFFGRLVTFLFRIQGTLATSVNDRYSLMRCIDKKWKNQRVYLRNYTERSGTQELFSVLQQLIVKLYSQVQTRDRIHYVRCIGIFLCLFMLKLSDVHTNTLVAQSTVTISGQIFDNENIPLPGASVVEKGTTNGTATDVDGNYKLSVPEGTTLVISSIGYVSQEVAIGSRTKIDVVLSVDVKELKEIVVVGYGTQNKSTFTGSAVTLNQKNLNKAPVSLENLLQGKMSGVQIFQNNSTPGAPLSIRIRGTNSLNANSEPLYVVDGLPLSEGIGYSMNPEDIASITVLKDASSTSIYGARGANGVVMITTKSGENRKSQISLHSNYGVQRVIGKFDLQEPYDFAVRTNKLEVDKGNLPPYNAGQLDTLKLGIRGTDWQEEVFQAAVIQNHTLSFSGGTKNTSVYSSLNFTDQEGVIVNTKYQRFGGRLNIDQKINEKFKLSSRLFVNYGTQKDLPSSPSTINGFLKQVLRANPASSFDEGASVRDAKNPLHFMAARKRNNTFLRTQGYFSFQYEIIKGLTAKADIGTTINTNTYKDFIPSTVPLAAATNGKASILRVDQYDVLFNPTLNYETDFGDHSMKLLAGYNIQDLYYNELGIGATNFSSDDLGFDNIGLAQEFNAYTGKAQIKRRSWFGRVNYDFKDKYIFTGTFRVDGSSVFGANNKLGYFPSAAVAWRFSEESFIKDNLGGILSNGKARISYGVTGNDRINSGNSLATFSGNASTRYTFDGASSVTGIAVTRLPNSDLKWEETSSLDIGLDLSFFGDRINFEADYYTKNTHDLILTKSISPSTGFPTRIGNDGEVENKGIELSLQGIAVRNNDFEWGISATYAKNKNEIKALGKNNADIFSGAFKPDGSANFANPFIIRVGESIGSFYGYQYDGIIQEGDPVLTSTHPNAKVGDPKYINVNGDSIINADDRQVLGVGVPDVTLGITNTITFKNFSLDILLQGLLGGYLLNTQRTDLTNPISAGNVLNIVRDETWSPENKDGTIPAAGFYGTAHGNWVNSHFVEKSDFLRVKNITFTYTLPSSVLERMKLTSLSFYINAQNLHTFTNYSGLDPEVGNLVDNAAAREQNRNAARGIDFNSYPVSRMFLGGVKLTF